MKNADGASALHAGLGVKKPRIFYWEDSIDAWCPADGLELESIIGPADMFHEGEEQTFKFKRVDMTDAEFAAIPDD